VYVANPGCGAGGVAHETLHAAGLWHEQSRADRDRHVRILAGNIEPGFEHNFEMHASDGVDIGPHDLNSIYGTDRMVRPGEILEIGRFFDVSRIAGMHQIG
jgi:hypothetical protein